LYAAMAWLDCCCYLAPADCTACCTSAAIKVYG
jgi:hypothetical protein